LSKESRRRQRQAGQVPASGQPAHRRVAGAAAESPARSSSPRGTERAGRRERARPIANQSFIQRYRVILVGAAVVAVVALVGAALFSSATEKTYACSSTWQPAPTPSPRADASPAPGYVQPDMGHTHVATGSRVTYTYCPPASGNHYQQPAAPIAGRVYGPTDTVVPEQWIHNLEHGAIVVLYKGAQVDEAALSALFASIPASPVCGFPPSGQSTAPAVVARFDDMAWPFAAVVWDRVLPLQTLDQQAILDFQATWAEKTNPEKFCAEPSASPAASTEPSATPLPSAAPSSSASPSESAPASASPS
jgi:hypothetical protein